MMNNKYVSYDYVVKNYATKTMNEIYTNITSNNFEITDFNDFNELQNVHVSE